jgi:putative nucleotidyltransferase with HDIG domain
VSAAALEAARRALAGGDAWLVGGAVRDRLLGRRAADLDVVVAGDSAEAARAVARAAGRVACFALSEEFGAWRIVARDGSWQLDVEPMRGATIEEDLGLRDFTVNAVAEPLSGGPPIDPLGGLSDLEAGRLRMAGPGAFADDPLRVLRLVRVAIELGLEPQEATTSAARERARDLARVSGERVFLELRRILAASRARDGVELMRELGALAVVLPEVEEMRGIEQSRFHHLDVYDHTLEVLDRTVAMTSPTAGADGELADTLRGHREAVADLLAEPLADEMTRGDALRWGALLHDVAKPVTREVHHPGGRVTFIGHDVRGAELARALLTRLRASERLRAHVAALVRHHLTLGFLVHEPQPLDRRRVFAYLRGCEPVEVDVTLLSIADRQATRGDRASEAIAAHMELAHGMLGDALAWRAQPKLAPLLRGDELARELGIAPGPRLGELLERIAEARYAGELASGPEALAYARRIAREGR